MVEGGSLATVLCSRDGGLVVGRGAGARMRGGILRSRPGRAQPGARSRRSRPSCGATGSAAPAPRLRLSRASRNDQAGTTRDLQFAGQGENIARGAAGL